MMRMIMIIPTVCDYLFPDRLRGMIERDKITLTAPLHSHTQPLSTYLYNVFLLCLLFLSIYSSLYNLSSLPFHFSCSNRLLSILIQVPCTDSFCIKQQSCLTQYIINHFTPFESQCTFVVPVTRCLLLIYSFSSFLSFYKRLEFRIFKAAALKSF